MLTCKVLTCEVLTCHALTCEVLTLIIPSSPLWCGSKGMIVDRRIAAQIAAHFCALVCDDADYQAARIAILEFASTSHRAVDLGLVEERSDWVERPDRGGEVMECEVER